MILKLRNILIACSILCGTLHITANTPLWQGKGRIAISSDGNEHDNDDWSATPFTLAILNAAGLQNNVTLYTYSDHIWGSNQTFPMSHGMCAYDQMRESALVGGKMFGYDNTRFICAVDNAEVAYNAMRDEINRSSNDNPLIIIAAGPMQVVGEALHRANQDVLRYVTVLSHSEWNNDHADKPHGKINNPKNPQPWDMHSGWTWNKMKKAFQSKGLKMVYIKDQNGSEHGFDGGLFCKKHYFDWLKDLAKKDILYYKAGSLKWLYSRLEVCQKGKNHEAFDISDAGMAMYLVTGKEDNSVDDLCKIISNPLCPKKW